MGGGEHCDSEIRIRPLWEEDIEALAHIEAESFSQPWSAEDFRRMLEVSDAVYLVAVMDEEPVGSAGMRILAGEGNIDNVVVAPAQRGRGIGSMLIESLLEAGRDRGIRDFTLEVRVSNAPAIRIYEKAGFVSEGIRPHFYEHPVEDASIMWLRG